MRQRSAVFDGYFSRSQSIGGVHAGSAPNPRRDLYCPFSGQCPRLLVAVFRLKARAYTRLPVHTRDCAWTYTCCRSWRTRLRHSSLSAIQRHSNNLVKSPFVQANRFSADQLVQAHGTAGIRDIMPAAVRLSQRVAVMCYHVGYPEIDDLLEQRPVARWSATPGATLHLLASLCRPDDPQITSPSIP